MSGDRKYDDGNLREGEDVERYQDNEVNELGARRICVKR